MSTNDLTPAEQQFFATGELPQELITTPEPVSAPSPAPAPATMVAPIQEETLEQKLIEERNARARLENSLGGIMQKLEELQAIKPSEKTPEPIPPDPLNDPLGAMLHKLDQVTKAVTELQQNTASQSQMTSQQKEFNELTLSIKSARDEFTKTQPDFVDAYKHLRSARADDLRDVGVPESKIAEALLHDEIAVSKNAIAQGKNPAQVIYNMAKRYGYVQKAASAPSDKIAQITNGQAAAIAPPRGAQDTTLTFEGLRDASDSDLTKLVLDDKTWNSLIGNRNTSIF